MSHLMSTAVTQIGSFGQTSLTSNLTQPRDEPMSPNILNNDNDNKQTASNDNPLIERKQSKSCLACGALGVKNRCGGCRQVYFCNQQCQKQIWLAHRPECQRLSASAQSNTISSNGGIAINTNTNVDVGAGNANETNVGSSTSANSTNVASSPTTAMDEAIANEKLANKMATPPKESSSPSSAPAKVTPSPRRKKSVVIVTEPVVVSTTAAPTEEEEAEAKTPSKKKKNKKKKPRSNSLHAPSSASMAVTTKLKAKGRSQSLSAKKHIIWGAVHVREFTRFPGGGSAVPYDGSWALGLGSPVADVQIGSVLEIEELRLQELDARAKELTKSKRSHVREGETRQFDYKSGARNPLFGRLSERERKKLFSEAELKHMEELEDAHVHSTHSSQRKLSIDHHIQLHSPSGGLYESHEPSLDEADFACVSSEQLNEFVQIRDSRDESCGCSCGDLVKKVSKMNVKKLIGFLAAREVTMAIATHSKMEIMAMAKKIAKDEKNCSNQKDCECAKNGVACHSNVCVGCAGDCWNPHDQYSYQKDHVREYRKLQLAKWKEQTNAASVGGGTARPSVCVA